ncbi:hypothetical protein [Microvirga sp. P5_D2]
MTNQIGPAEKLANVGFKAATGTDDADLQQELISQIIMALPLAADGSEANRQVAAAVAALAALKPQDGLEGMAAAQIVLVHHAAVDCMRKAMAQKTPEAQDLCFRQATRLMAMFQRQLEGLDRHRGKGAAMVNVEMVNVGAGGQAVVGAVDARAPHRLSRRGSGPSVAQVIDHQPVARLAENSPAALPFEDERLKRPPVEETSDDRGSDWI